MWTGGRIAGVVLAGLVIGAGAMPVANAEPFGHAINGVYLAVSNGEWAKTNDVYMDEATVAQTWTFTSSCSTPHICTGEVVSSQGWTAPMEFRTSRWIVDRFHPDWQRCPDGTTAAGRQRFQFQATDANGQYDTVNETQLTGYDRTITESGACGRNQQTVITMPLTVKKL